MKQLYILVLIFSPALIQSANILFMFGGGNLSHKISIWPFVTALADKGHNVTFVSSSAKKPTEHPGVRDVAPKAFQDFTFMLYRADRIKDRKMGVKWDMSNPGYDEVGIMFCETTFKAAKSDEDPVFKDLIKNGKFDLVIINIAFNECSHLLVHHFGAKYILFSSTVVLPWHYGTFGIPMEMSWIPELLGDGKHPMGLLDRMWNTYRYLQGYTRRASFGQTLIQMYREHFDLGTAVLPTFDEMEKNSSLVFLNTHHSIEFARSLPPMFVHIGGMQCWSPVGELPLNFKEYMDGAEEGVILITFGSTISINSLDEEYINIYFETMRKFNKVRFIWRWEGPMPANHPENVMASKWLPQREILDHPKTIGFMSHGGVNSINEATFHGVPLIVFPLFADQDYNAYRIEAQELGVSVEFMDFSQELLDLAVGEIITNPKYKKNMKTRSKIFKDRSRSPAEEAVYWTEFVLRQDDTSALKPMLLDQPWYVRTSFDVFFVLTMIAILVPVLVGVLITRIASCFN